MRRKVTRLRPSAYRVTFRLQRVPRAPRMARPAAAPPWPRLLPRPGCG
eukprot:COSAG04_NODE_19291_length_419_cov_10.418750_1_plen_47_part_01